MWYVITLISIVTISIAIVEIMFLICHLTSRKHMFKELCEYMDYSFLRSVMTLPCLKAIGQVQMVI